MLRAERGFSLVEMMVATAIIGAALGLSGALFAASRSTIQEQILRTETTQGLRAVLDTLARDLRLGGACLPSTGTFVPLAGTNVASTDTIVTRTGLVQTANYSCVRTTISSNTTSGATQIPILSTTGFAAGMRAYIRHASNGTGEFVTISSVDTTTSRILIGSGTSQTYPSTSGVYGIDERTYSIDTSNSALPVLQITVNGGNPMPFAYGVESMNIQYLLQRAAPNVVDLPASNSEWGIVNALQLSVTVRSRTTGINGQYFRRTGQVEVKPRNLLPGASVLGDN